MTYVVEGFLADGGLERAGACLEHANWKVAWQNGCYVWDVDLSVIMKKWSNYF